jgi:hypothetical protein
MNYIVKKADFVALAARSKLDFSAYRLINYVDTKAKCRHIKKFTYKGTSRQVFICLRLPSTPITPHGPHTLYTCIL